MIFGTVVALDLAVVCRAGSSTAFLQVVSFTSSQQCNWVALQYGIAVLANGQKLWTEFARPLRLSFSEPFLICLQLCLTRFSCNSNNFIQKTAAQAVILYRMRTLGLLMM